MERGVEMLERQLVLFLMVGVGVAASQTTCSPKIFNENGIATCDFLEGKPDTTRFNLTLGLVRPHFSEENTPENLAKLRRWTDTLFLQHDLRYWGSRNQSAQPPSDSMLSWSYSFLYLDKATILAVAERSFVKEIWYSSTPPAVNILRPNRQVPNQAYRYYEINGRSIVTANEGAEDVKPKARNLLRR